MQRAGAVHRVLDDEHGRARRDDAGHRPDGAAAMAGRERDVPEAASASASSAVRAQPSNRIAARDGPRIGQHICSHEIGGPACSNVCPASPSASRAGRTPVHAGRARHRRSSASRFAAATFTTRISPGDADFPDRAAIIVSGPNERPAPDAPRNHEVVPRRHGERSRRSRRPRRKVHAVVGENGAGQEHADEDPVRLLPRRRRRDQARRAAGPDPLAAGRATAIGIGMVFQDFVQVPALTRGREHRPVPAGPALQCSTGPRSRAASGRCPSRYGLDVDPSAPVWQLSVGERQKRGGRQAPARGRAGPDPRRAHPKPGARTRSTACFAIFADAPARRLCRGVHRPQAARGAGVRRPHHGDAPGRIAGALGARRGHGERARSR